MVNSQQIYQSSKVRIMIDGVPKWKW
jgi:hypothetical protein